MYENDTKTTSERARGAPGSGVTATRSTDPKFARESFTMRKMQAWQVVALAIAAAVVVGLIVFYV